MSDNQPLENGDNDFSSRSTELTGQPAVGGKFPQLQHVQITKTVTDGSGNKNDVVVNLATDDKLELLRLLLNDINGKTINTSNISGSVSVSNFPSSFSVNTISGFATETTLNDVKTALNDLKTYNDQVEGKLDAVSALLTTIQGFVDGVETLLTGIRNDNIISGNTTEVILSVTSTSQSLVASNSSRKMGVLYNKSDVDVYYALGTTATTNSFCIKPEGYALVALGGKVFTGAVHLRHASSGNKNVNFIQALS